MNNLLISGSSQQLAIVKSETKMSLSTLLAESERMLFEQVRMTHASESLDVDVKPLIDLVQVITNYPLGKADDKPLANGEVEHLAVQNGIIANGIQIEAAQKCQISLDIVLNSLSYTAIDQISYEISSKAHMATDAHSLTLSVLRILGNYSWQSKLMLTWAAFVSKYGEFWLLSHFSTNKAAVSIAILKQLTGMLRHREKVEEIKTLITAMMKVTDCVINTYELQATNCISTEVNVYSTTMSYVPWPVYVIIRSIVACVTQIARLTVMTHDRFASPTETGDLNKFVGSLEDIHQKLTMQLNHCHKHIDEQKDMEAYQKLLSLFSVDMTFTDHVAILKALLCAKGENQQLCIRSTVGGEVTVKKETISVLEKKNVLLLISGLQISQSDLTLLKSFYSNEAFKSNQCEIVWIPMVSSWEESTVATEITEVHSEMTWYKVENLNLIGNGVTRFIQEKWHFSKEAILVGLDHQSTRVCLNAFHMMRVWDTHAIPLTCAREEALWRETNWQFDQLIRTDETRIYNWIQNNECIFLYGGTNISWATQFTTSVLEVTKQVFGQKGGTDSGAGKKRNAQLIYVGSSKEELVVQIKQQTESTKIDFCEQAFGTSFWTRLESMLLSTFQASKGDEDVAVQIKNLVRFDKEEGWLVLCQGATIKYVGHHKQVDGIIKGFEIWRENLNEDGTNFEDCFAEHEAQLSQDLPCCNMEFDPDKCRIPDYLKCPQKGCNRPMKKLITFRCCHKDQTTGPPMRC